MKKHVGTWTVAAACVAVAAGLMGCAAVPPTTGASMAEVPEQFSVPGWSGMSLPGKRATLYGAAQQDGRPAIHALSVRSASMLRKAMTVTPEQLHDFRFSWWVPAMIPGAALGVAETDDAPVRVVLAFEGDHSKLSMRDRMQFDLAEAVTGERPPYATLMYVWDPRRAADEVVHSPRTDRIRKVVVESGSARLKRWCEYRRDVVADFRRAYGEEPGRLVAVGVMTDSDNTQSQAEAWYGEPRFVVR